MRSRMVNSSRPCCGRPLPTVSALPAAVRPRRRRPASCLIPDARRCGNVASSVRGWTTPEAGRRSTRPGSSVVSFQTMLSLGTPSRLSTRKRWPWIWTGCCMACTAPRSLRSRILTTSPRVKRQSMASFSRPVSQVAQNPPDTVGGRDPVHARHRAAPLHGVEERPVQVQQRFQRVRQVADLQRQQEPVVDRTIRTHPGSARCRPRRPHGSGAPGSLPRGPAWQVCRLP